MKKKWKAKVILLVALFLFLLIGNLQVVAVPIGPTITTISNSTKASGGGQIYNETGNSTDDPDKAGGFIYTIGISAETQNARWKGYVGNVSGSLVLDDADGYSIYDWTLNTSISGEVYATRSSGTIAWADIGCSTDTNISNEEIAINHTTNPSDNISATFDAQDNQEFYVGNVQIAAGSCYTTNLFLNDAAPGGDQWEEVLLHDGASMVYTSIISDDVSGYRTGQTYDFQIMLPERGFDGWTSSTAYYFYVELN